VYVGAETPTSLAGSSKYGAGAFAYPSPWSHPDEYVACLVDAIRRWNVKMVLPLTDVAIEVIAERRAWLGEDVVLPIPSLEQYRRLSDKYQVTLWAEREGIPIPQTVFVPNGDATDVSRHIRDWPVVIKPGRSLVKVDGKWQKAGVLYAHDRDDLLRCYERQPVLKAPSLIQERVAGDGQGVFGLFDRGQPVALFAHRRLRERPPSGGVSVLRESIPLPKPMTDYGLRIIQSVGWHGVAMVEFKVDQRSGVPYFMEVNGRFWGSLQLAIDSGVDFPWMLYQLGCQSSFTKVGEPYRIGVKSRWWFGDLDHVLLRFMKPERELNLPVGAPSRLAVLRDFLMPGRATQSEVLRWRDPQPAIYEAVAYCQPLLRRVTSAVRNRLKRIPEAVRKASWTARIRLGVHRWILGRLRTQSIKSVLVVCKGNVCRSPFAEQYLKARVRQSSIALDVVSAGLDTTAGKPAYPLARTTSLRYGIDLEYHRTTELSPSLVDHADLIVVMEPPHNEALFRGYPAARRKTVLMGLFARQPVAEIEDPYGGSPEQFERCYAVLAEACDGLLALVSRSQR